MVKLIIMCKRKTGLSREEFISHWKNVHASLARQDASFWSRVRGFTQYYGLPDVGLPAAVGVSADKPWDGVVELWFDNAAEMNAAFSGEETVRVLVADHDNFVDSGSLISVLTEENVIAPRSAPPAESGPRKAHMAT